MKPLLLLSTLHRAHAAHSGYQALAASLPEARFLHTIRADPPGGLALFGARLARQLSFSRWYLGGCAALELRARRELKTFSGIVHSMWTDHDMGFLDLMLDPRRHKLVGSFHNCLDTFPETIRFPKRLCNFDAIILMSETQKPFFLGAGVDEPLIHVVHHGVDTDYFCPPAAAPSSFTVLAAGSYRRNFPLLREVCLKVPSISFEIIAPPAWKHLFEDLPNVKYRSGVGDAEFLQAYQSCSCLLQTVENSTANNVILEAMACGQPIVAERIGGIPEYVDESCGILTPPGDADALANALIKLRGDPAFRHSLSAGARNRAESLAWNNVAARMREIYERL